MEIGAKNGRENLEKNGFFLDSIESEVFCAKALISVTPLFRAYLPLVARNTFIEKSLL
ncbi:MAG: hypothetical protein V1798_05365 [Pseudomonadota bacterium]